MNTLLAAVIAAMLSPVWLPTAEIRVAALPEECRKYCSEVSDPVEVGCLDMDNDGENEMIIKTGFGGSGGSYWSVFTRNGKKWELAGEIDGTAAKVGHADRNGIVVSWALGWGAANWCYYELIDKKLVRRLELMVEYAPPEDRHLRRKPVEIKIKYTEQKQSGGGK